MRYLYFLIVFIYFDFDYAYKKFVREVIYIFTEQGLKTFFFEKGKFF